MVTPPSLIKSQHIRPDRHVHFEELPPLAKGVPLKKSILMYPPPPTEEELREQREREEAEARRLKAIEEAKGLQSVIVNVSNNVTERERVRLERERARLARKFCIKWKYLARKKRKVS